MFDRSKASRVCNFFESTLKHLSGGMTPFRLLPWQRRILAKIFWNVDEDGGGSSGGLNHRFHSEAAEQQEFRQIVGGQQP